MPYEVHTYLNGPLEQNCYYLRAEGAEDGILVDPGSNPDLLLQKLGAWKPALMVATHGHFDHIGAVAALADRYGCPFAMARKDEALLESLEDSFEFYGMGHTRKPDVSFWLEAGKPVHAAGLTLKVLETPGHTPGGLCFFHAVSNSLFSGDTLFAGSIGRSDFEGSSHTQLIASIRRELFSLPELDLIRVYPGHGEASTLGEELRSNPFLQ
ncbi:MAG: MBL fold metallo-hydrolase [bacterium]